MRGAPRPWKPTEGKHMRNDDSSSKARGDISSELDALTSALLGDALDMLADGEDLNVLLVVESANGEVSPFEFSDDGPEELLEGARSKVRELGKEGHAGGVAPVRYAIAYEGAVADEAGAFQDAVIVEFGERGRTSYSAFSYVDGKGSGDGFRWSDPAPAGVTESLL